MESYTKRMESRMYALKIWIEKRKARTKHYGSLDTDMNTVININHDTRNVYAMDWMELVQGKENWRVLWNVLFRNR